LNDSLDLRLDDQYLVTLEETSSRKYDINEYDGDLDEDEYALKRKILMRGKFHYEEYELSALNFTSRTNIQHHNRGRQLHLLLKATDENELPVMDARADIVLTTLRNRPIDFFRPTVFLPDTLWKYSLPLETIGETKIIIPDSVFPAASFSYNIHCTLLTSNNQQKIATVAQTFSNNPYAILLEEKEDSLRITRWKGDNTDSAPASLFAFNENDDTLSEHSIQLPTTIAINPYAAYYEVITDSATEEFKLDNKRGLVSCVAMRTKDSVYIRVVNPGKLHFWYSIFASNKMVKKGYGNDLFYSARSFTRSNYFVALQYVYGNKVYKEEYIVPFQQNLLNIETDQPEFVYPGQEKLVNIVVKDTEGKPVAGADVTAFAFTQKFTNARQPYVPYFGKLYPPRKKIPELQSYKEYNEVNSNIRLNWNRWGREMGLDSISYFLFLHTPALYTDRFPASDSITQFAPFVLHNGEIQPIQQLYIDEVPVFFLQAAKLQRYSFRAGPGYHSIRIRTADRMISLDSLWLEKGLKTIVGINIDTTTNKRIRVMAMPDTLSNHEKALWSKYMILVENTFQQDFAYIEQNNNFFLLNNPANEKFGPRQLVLAGPFTGQPADFVVKDRYTLSFEPEGNYLFLFSKNLIKQKQIPYTKYTFNKQLDNTPVSFDFHDFVLTAAEVDSLWTSYIERRGINEDLFFNSNNKRDGNGELRINLDIDKQSENLIVKRKFLFRYDDPDFIGIYKGNTLNFGYLQPGWYRFLALTFGNKYVLVDSIYVREDGISYYRPGNLHVLPNDSISSKIASVLSSRLFTYYDRLSEQELAKIKHAFNSRYFDNTKNARIITGRVRDLLDEKGIPAVSISIKGTNIGTYSMADGYFSLKTPPKGTLLFQAVGYSPVELRLANNDYYEVAMAHQVNNLNEVVVTGYAISRKKELTASISNISVSNVLSGKAAGVFIRGAKTADSTASPLILVDGLPYSGDYTKLDSSIIASIRVLKGQEAEDLYGKNGENGVILITTKNRQLASPDFTSENAMPPVNSIRRKFRDDAYWQPSLLTDKNGNVSFKASFPDDITKWRSFFIAVKGKQTGFLENSVKSFKSVTATIAVPQFLVEGDSLLAIGKITNYQPDSIRVLRKFQVDEKQPTVTEQTLKNILLDTFVVRAEKKDSIRLTYSIVKSDGYFDGEERVLPVYKQGVQESNGIFCVLDRDSSFVWEPNPAWGNVKLYAEASIFPVLLDEIESLRSYEYLCNEQIASKLKALLLKKRIYSLLKKEFKEDRNIGELVERLKKSKTQGTLWGWWVNNDHLLWVSQHVLEALIMAEQMGYKIDISKQALIDYLVYNLETQSTREKIHSLHILQLLNAKIDYQKYIDTISTRPNLAQYDQLQLLLLKRKSGQPVNTDSLWKHHRTTAFGNVYWGKEEQRLFENSVQETILHYQILKLAGGYEEQLKKVRYYFLEKRKNGRWENTYESSQILETILPDLLNEKASGPSTLVINNEPQIQVFPFSRDMQSPDSIRISKKGTMPLYFTAYQQYWNEVPGQIDGNFKVKSFFEQNGDTIKKLTAGKNVVMKVEVVVNADADFVMVEIPIPAGCSYSNKKQSYLNNEVHREYFKNKVNIFCSRLAKGKYTFSISLLPRYQGIYHINPAKAEMMYFPTFYGREGMKITEIR
jgi:TonB-dependent SusC/RagA subfamily outer membrane receptor